MNKVAGQAPKSIWLMLIDGYHCLNQKQAFNEAAVLYAKILRTSPPSWEDYEEESESNKAKDVLVLDGYLHAFDKEKIKEFVLKSRENKDSKLDLSRTVFRQHPQDIIEDLKLLLSIMKTLRAYKVKTVLMGENQIVESLREVISENQPLPEAQMYWFLLLEFLQWRGKEDAYETLAFQFAKQFGASAPGYESLGVIAIAPKEKNGADVKYDGLNPPEELNEENVKLWLDALENQKLPYDEVTYVNFKYVKKISLNAALSIVQKLNDWKITPQHMVFQLPSELVVALFENVGVSQLVHIEQRKR